MYKLWSSLGSFDVFLFVFRELVEGLFSVVGVDDVVGSFSLGNGYNLVESYNVNGRGSGGDNSGGGGVRLLWGLVIKVGCLVGGVFFFWLRVKFVGIMFVWWFSYLVVRRCDVVYVFEFWIWLIV